MTSVEFLTKSPVARELLCRLERKSDFADETISIPFRERAAWDLLIARGLVVRRTIWPTHGSVYTVYRLTANGWLALEQLERIIIDGELRDEVPERVIDSS